MMLLRSGDGKGEPGDLSEIRCVQRKTQAYSEDMRLKKTPSSRRSRTYVLSIKTSGALPLSSINFD